MDADDTTSQAGPSLFVGCCGFGQQHRKRYTDRLNAVEYQQSFFMPPKPGSMVKLREQTDPDFAFIVKAWQLVTHQPGRKGYPRCNHELTHPLVEYGLLQPTEAVDQAWQRTLRCAEAAHAQGILLETPASFTPTAANRRHLSQFFEAAPRWGQQYIWDPRGIWGSREVSAICGDLKLVQCWDPVAREGFPPGDVAYLKVTNLASPSALSVGELEWLADGLSQYSTAYCIFNTTRMFADAFRLHDLLEGEDLLLDE